MMPSKSLIGTMGMVVGFINKVRDENPGIFKTEEEVEAYFGLDEATKDKGDLADKVLLEAFTGLNDVTKAKELYNILMAEGKDAFVEDIDSLYKGLGSIKNRGIDFGSYIKDKGIDFGKMFVQGIGNVIAPPLGFLASAFQRPAYPSDAMSKSFAVENYGNPYNYNMGSGNLTGKDPFGINTISIGGNYPAYYDQYARDYRAGKYSPTSKFAAAKYAHSQAVNKANQERIARDFFVNDDSDGNDIINIPSVVNTPTVVNNTGNGGGGGNFASQNTGTNENFSNKTGRGRTGYGRGGIASL